MNSNLNSDDENPYDFIFKEDQAAPTSAVPGFGNKNKQMILFGGFVVAILIVVMIVFSIISSSGKDKGTEAISVRAYQTEISRILGLGDKNSREVELRKKLTTLRLVLTTDQARLDKVIAAKQVVATALQVNQYKSANRDQALTASLQVDTHDTVYEQIVDELVSQYYNAALDAEKAARTTAERASLEIVRKNIETMYNAGDSEQDGSQSDDITDSTDQQTQDESTSPATEPGNSSPESSQSI